MCLATVAKETNERLEEEKEVRATVENDLQATSK